MNRTLGTPHDQIHTTIYRALGVDVSPVFTRTKSGFYWCRLELPEWRFNRPWVCCPGETREKALSAAIRQARRHEKAVA